MDDKVKKMDLYSILKVHPQAHSDDITRAYNQQRLLLQGPELEEMDLAHSVLSDPGKRREYDEHLFSRVKVIQNRDSANPSIFNVPENLLGIMLSGRMPVFYKLFLVFSLIYFLSPIDFVPDMLPGAGFIDDIVLLLLSYLLGYRNLNKL
ncbi:MAG: DUF1232 domain-containing protein [Candidatus Wallbacteria bacterium]|nr:DUF1232 domain-containing protein [Candidatus Wallbacteria bacterium]